MWWSLVALAVPPTDLDGDGKPEVIEVLDAEIRVGKHRLACEGPPCAVEVHDLSSEDPLRELVVLETGMRDDRLARIYRLTKAGLVELKLTRPGGEGVFPEAVTTSGNGILLTDERHRLYLRREKFVPDGAGLKLVPQPFWSVGQVLPVDRSAPIRESIGGAVVVANLKPGSEVTVVLESAEKPEWFLLRTSTGLVGWIDLETLRSASDRVAAIYGAG